MSDRGYHPAEVVCLLHLRDYELVVKCLELVLLHVSDFAPECQSWEIETIAFCHHHPDNIYPALGVFSGAEDYDEVERFSHRADEWARKQALGWWLDESSKVSTTSWNVLREKGRSKADGDKLTQPAAAAAPTNWASTSISIPCLRHFRDYEFVVKCLELIRMHVPDFAPECRSWKIDIVAFCHQHPDNVYPSLRVISGYEEFEDVERFFHQAEEWARKQPLGWWFDASTRVFTKSWKALREGN